MPVWTLEELAVTGGQCMPVWTVEEVAVTSGQCMLVWTLEELASRGQWSVHAGVDTGGGSSTAVDCVILHLVNWVTAQLLTGSQLIVRYGLWSQYQIYCMTT